MQGSQSAQAQTDWAERYGPICIIDAGQFGKAVCISDPEIQRNVANNSGFGRNPLKAECVAEAFGSGITGTVGEEWRWRRSSLMREFNNARLMSPEMGLFEAILEDCEDMCLALGRAADAGELVDIEGMTMKFGTAVVLYLLFGRRVPCNERAFMASEANLWKVYGANLQTKMQGVALESEEARKIGEMKETAHAVFDEVVRPELHALLEELETGNQGRPGRKECVMGSLLRREPRYATLGLEGLLAETRVLIVAGFGTTSTQLALTIGLLADPQNAAMALRAGHEAAAAMSLGLERTTFRERTAYANGLFSEALRLLPIFGSSNGKAHADITVEVGSDSYTVPKGSEIFFWNAPGQRCARVWPEPDRFDPDRWASPSLQKELMAFGRGPHECAGRSLAFLEARLLLTVVLSRFRFELPPEETRFETRTDLVTRPRGPLRVFRR